MIELYRPLRDQVSQVISGGSRVVSIAGDCCSTLGVLAGLQQAGISPFLIWLDAHGDFNTWETTPSGFLGGMPLAMIVGKGEQTIVTGLGLENLPESSVILSDGRDLDQEEKLALQNSDIVQVKDVNQLLSMSLPLAPVYLHFDTDLIRPSEAPAMNYPAKGGPSVSELKKVFRYLAQHTQLCAISISTWNPALDHDLQSRDAVFSLLKVLLEE
jgi:arginase